MKKSCCGCKAFRGDTIHAVCDLKHSMEENKNPHASSVSGAFWKPTEKCEKPMTNSKFVSISLYGKSI